MKVKYIGKTDEGVLTHNSIYDVISIEKKWYRIIPDIEDDDTEPLGYLFPPKLFEIVEE